MAQRSFYPLYPPALGASVDSSLAGTRPSPPKPRPEPLPEPLPEPRPAPLPEPRPGRRRIAFQCLRCTGSSLHAALLGLPPLSLSRAKLLVVGGSVESPSPDNHKLGPPELRGNKVIKW